MRHATQQKHGAQLHALNSTGSSVQSPLSSASSHNSNSPHSQSQLQHLQSNQMQSQIQQQNQQQDFLTQQIQQMVSYTIFPYITATLFTIYSNLSEFESESKSNESTAPTTGSKYKSNESTK